MRGSSSAHKDEAMDEPAPEIVIRLSNIAVDQAALEARLGIALDRYEPSPHGPLFYAQLVMHDDTGNWHAMADFLKQVGPKIAALVDDLAIGSATIDFAVFMADDHVTKSLRIPARIAVLAGENQIDIETSVYRTFSEN